MPAPARIAVMDLEWTTWEGAIARNWQGPGEEREIVQIGAVKLIDGDGFAETDAFDLLVKPRLNPTLSDYFVELTGITQARLAREGVDFPAALDRLQAFLADVGSVWSNGADDWILKRNCDLNGLPFPFAAGLFRNIRDEMARLAGYDPARATSSDLPRIMGFPRPGTAHQGVDDCRCIAETLRILRRQGKL